MKSFLLFIGAFTISIITWIISDSSFLGLISFIPAYVIIKILTDNKGIKKSGLTRSEYKLVQKNLKEAKAKISRLQKALFSMNNLLNARQNIETIRIVNKIYSTTKNDPRRFFLVDEFYYSHLDSIVELAEKYSFLSKQPAKTKELTAQLRDTRATMDQMHKNIKEDLYQMLEGDIDSLKFELDVVKNTLNKKKL